VFARSVGISITLWATEADLLAGESSGYLAEQLGKLAPYFTAPPEREVYEVSHTTVPEIPATA
jgi:hypothetical protein